MSDRAARIREMLAAIHDAFERRDLESIGRHFTADVRCVLPAGELRGRQARLDEEQRILDALSNCSLDVTTTLIEGNQAIEFCVLHGRHTSPLVTPAGTIPPSGGTISLRFVAHYKFEGDEIAFQEILFDQASLGQQMGA